MGAYINKDLKELIITLAGQGYKAVVCKGAEKTYFKVKKGRGPTDG